MAGLRSAEGSAARFAWARRLLPLPPGERWRASEGWLPAGLILLVAGALGAVLSVWWHLAPGSRPVPDRLLPLGALLAVAAAAVRISPAPRAEGEERFWRWLTIAAAIAGAIWCDPAGRQARLWIPWLLVAGLLGLALRAGETVAAVVGRALGAGHGALLQAPPGAVEAGDDAVRTAWGLVGECWLLAAAAVAIWGPGPDYRAAAAGAALGGALLLLGTRLAVLRASWAGRGFTVDDSQWPAHWGLGGAVAVALTAILLVLPLLPGPLSGHVVGPVLHDLARAAIPSPTTGTDLRTAHLPPPPSSGALGLVGALLALIRLLTAVLLGRLLILLPLLVATHPLLVPALFLMFLLVRYPGQAWGLLQRLLALLISALAFWGWLRWPGRMRAALRRLGLLRASPAPSAPQPGGLARLWALLDPRAAVRLSYRHFLRGMAAAGSARPQHVSPRAFAAALGEGAAAPGIADLTAAYELARYSDHPAQRGWVQMARRGLAAARGLVGRRRRPPRARRPGT